MLIWFVFQDLLEEPFRELTEDDRVLVANALSNASRWDSLDI